jgi:hypothetical protein
MTQQEYFDEILKIEEYLQKEGIDCETFVYPNDFDKVDVNIDCGDWKHDHIVCDELMKAKGWELESESVNDDDDDDCYSSTHTYKRIK